jgi:hypothetical protein
MHATIKVYRAGGICIKPIKQNEELMAFDMILIHSLFIYVTFFGDM